MGVTEQLAYETRVRPRQAVIAGAAAALLLLSPLMGLAGIHTKVDELTLDLITIHKRYPLDLIAAVIQAIGLLLLADTLGWLADRTKVRNAAMRNWPRWVGITGAVAFAIGVAGGETHRLDRGQQVRLHRHQTYLQADALTSGGLIAVLPLVEQLGALLLTLGFIFIAMNAMRVGLLPRYLGYIGVAAGALVLFPIVPVPVVQCFWLAALAVLLAGRWPAGMPPAWSSGEAIPWAPAAPRTPPRASGPSATFAVRSPACHAAHGGRGIRRRRERRSSAASSAERTRANTPKRKRKHRR